MGGLGHHVEAWTQRDESAGDEDVGVADEGGRILRWPVSGGAC